MATLALHTPILLCTPDGTVVARNEAAVKWLIRPYRGVNLRGLLSDESYEVFRAVTTGAQSSGVLRLKIDSLYRTALTGVCRISDKPYLVLAFLSYLQIAPGSALYEDISLWCREAGQELLSILLRASSLLPDPDAPTQSVPCHQARTLAHIYRIQESIYTLLERLFPAPIDSTFPLPGAKPPCPTEYPVYEVLDTFRHALNTQLAASGFRLEVDINRVDRAARGQVDLRHFLMIILQIALFTLTFCDRHQAYAVFSVEDDVLSISVGGTVSKPPLLATSRTDFAALGQKTQFGLLDLLGAECLCRRYGWPLCYTLTDRIRDNFVISAKLSLIQRFDWQLCSPALCEADLRALGETVKLFVQLLLYQIDTPSSDTMQNS